MEKKKDLVAVSAPEEAKQKKKLTLSDDDLAALSDEELQHVSAGRGWPGTMRAH